MLLPVLAVIVGLALLVWSADRFIDGAAETAARLGVQPLVIGMVIVGFGTSAPELLVSTSAALDGNPGIAVGNAIGSNIANIALILGTAALLAPVAVHSRVVRREMPILILVSLLLLALLWNGVLGRMEGAVLLLLLLALLGFTWWEARTERGDSLGEGIGEHAIHAEGSLARALGWTALGLLLLVLSARLLVWGAVGLAQQFGVSELVIGLTVVAIGTSLPELAASIVAARRGQADLAVGNVVGSNLFNTLGVMGIPGVLAPSIIEPAVLYRDMPVMLGLTFVLFAIIWLGRGPARITRPEGVALLLMFLGYQALLLHGVL